MPHSKAVIAVFILTCFFIGSCKKINYGTSISIQNNLLEEITIKVFPKERPYSLMEEFEVPKGSETSLYWVEATDKNPLDIISQVYDSIQIYLEEQGDTISLSPYAAKNYLVNPFTDLDIWKNRIIEYETYTMTRSHHENLDHYFSIDSTNLVNNE